MFAGEALRKILHADRQCLVIDPHRDRGIEGVHIGEIVLLKAVDPVSQKTLVYFFEKSDLPDIYTFDTPIPVGIYDKALSIRIADLLA